MYGKLGLRCVVFVSVPFAVTNEIWFLLYCCCLKALIGPGTSLEWLILLHISQEWQRNWRLSLWYQKCSQYISKCFTYLNTCFMSFSFEYLTNSQNLSKYIMAANWIMCVRSLAWVWWLFYSVGTPRPNDDYRHHLSSWLQNLCRRVLKFYWSF